MVTKAGVPANKLIIGMALYGRSFQMAQAGCHGPDCRFTGPDSGARAGRCTETNGYISNYEIRQIIASSDNAQWISDDAGGDLLIYDDTQWVSWMSEENYNARVDWVRGLNFGGTSDWAVDLDGNYDIGEGPGDLRDTVFISPDLYEMEEPVVKCNSFPCTLVFPPWQLESPTTIRPEPTTLTFEEYWLTTQSHEPGESPVTTTAASLASTVITPSPLRLSSIDVWHAIVESDVEDGSLIWLTSSIILPEMTFTKTFPADPPDPSDPPGETTPPISRPPITWTYSPGVYPAKPYPTSDDPNDPDDPDDDPRPPTPPPDFPASVAFSEGPAEPTCLPGQACGGGCRKNCDSGSDSGGCAGPCGCIGLLDACPPGLGGCVGKGCGGGGGSSGGGSGGGGPGDDGPTTCSTRETASWCREQCRVEFYPESTTSTCQEDCTRTFSACSATDSTTTTTKTVTCPLTDDGNTDGFATMIYSGDFEYTMPSEPPTRPTSTTTSDNPDNPEPTGTPFPTLTPETGFHPLCFRDINDDNRYESFDLGISEEIVDNLCFSIADHLSPDVPIHAVVMADGLRAYIQWADDQTNCAPKADTPLGDFCKDTFWYLLETCDVFADGGVYGGGFVDNLDDGCTEWVIVNDSLAPRMLGNRLNSTVIELSVAN